MTLESLVQEMSILERERDIEKPLTRFPHIAYFIEMLYYKKIPFTITERSKSLETTNEIIEYYSALLKIDKEVVSKRILLTLYFGDKQSYFAVVKQSSYSKITKDLIASLLGISKKKAKAFRMGKGVIPDNMSPGTCSPIIPDTLIPDILHEDARKRKFRGLYFILGEEEMNLYSQNIPVNIGLGNPVGVDEQILDGRKYSMWIGLKDLFDTLKEGYEELGWGQLVYLISPDSTSQ